MEPKMPKDDLEARNGAKKKKGTEQANKKGGAISQLHVQREVMRQSWR